MSSYLIVSRMLLSFVSLSSFCLVFARSALLCVLVESVNILHKALLFLLLFISECARKHEINEGENEGR